MGFWTLTSRGEADVSTPAVISTYFFLLSKREKKNFRKGQYVIDILNSWPFCTFWHSGHLTWLSVLATLCIKVIFSMNPASLHVMNGVFSPFALCLLYTRSPNNPSTYQPEPQQWTCLPISALVCPSSAEAAWLISERPQHCQLRSVFVWDTACSLRPTWSAGFHDTFM